MAEISDLLSCIRNSLKAISNPRFFETERGFQGALLSQIQTYLRMPEQAILEQEYQKRLGEHGLKIRPDIIMHEPFNLRRHLNRTEGNYAVIELKLKTNESDAKDDFDKLAMMIEKLGYPLGIFVNVNSNLTFIEQAPKQLNGKIFSFATQLNEGIVQLQEGAL